MKVNKDKAEKYILYLPQWYPSRKDPQLGIFIRKHASSASLHMKVVVLYATGIDKLHNEYECSLSSKGNLTELIVYFRNSSGVFRKFVNFSRYIKAFKKGMTMIINENSEPCLLHSNALLRAALLAAYYSRKYHIPYVHTEHWTGFIHGAYERKSLLYKFLCRNLVRKARALLAVSANLLDKMKEKGVTNNNTYIVPNIIENCLSGIPQVRSDQKVRILTVADLVEKNKNVSGTLKALVSLRNNHPEIEFHIIGSGIDERLLANIAHKLDPMSEWIIFHGRRDNDYVLAFLQSIDFLVTNSNVETFSVITAEAIAAGKPVIATRCGGPEYFVNEKNGILVDPGDQQQLLDALERMTQSYMNYDPAVISAEIISRFGKETVGRQLFNIYQSIINKSS
jgi:glycosyltransferase involved in cell wall biosynthesis